MKSTIILSSYERSQPTLRSFAIILLALSAALAQNSDQPAGGGDAKQKVAHQLPGERITASQRQALSAFGQDVSWAFSEQEVPSYLMGQLSSRLHPHDAAAEAEATLRTYGAAFRMSPSDGFLLNGIDVDKSGMTHVRMAQTFQGMPVPERELVVHLDANFVRGISGNFAPEVVSVDEVAGNSKDATRAASAALAGPLPRNYFANPGFEAGNAGWLGQTYSWLGGTYGGGYSYVPPICGGATVSPAYAGRYCACPGGNGKTSTEWIGQSITMPSAAASGSLSFRLRITTSELPSAYDFLKIEIWNAAGTLRLSTLPTKFANNSGYTSWTNVSMPFPVTYSGTTVQVRLTVTEDFSNATTFYIDDVSLTFAGFSL